MSFSLDDVMGALKENKELAQKDRETILGEVKSVKDENQKLIGRLDEVEKAMEDIAIPGLKDELEKKEFSFAGAMIGIKNLATVRGITPERAFKGFDFEREVITEATNKALNASTDTAGGFVIPAEVIQSQFIDLLRERLVLQRLGVNFVTGLQGAEPLLIPEQTGKATGYWVGENEAATESEQTFGEREVRPKRCGAFIKVSNRLMSLANATPSFEQLIRNDLAAVLSRLMETGVLFGTGNKQPTGLVNESGVNTVALGTNGGILDYDDIDTMVGRIEDADADMLGDIGILMHNKVKRSMKRLKVDHFSGQTTNQAYLVGRPPMSDSELADLIGYRFATTNLIPTNLTKGTSTDCSYAIAGVWSQLLVFMWQNMTIRMSDVAGDSSGSALRQNQTWMVAEMEMDSMARQRPAFTIVSDARALASV